jgi:hypothetical protein
MPALWVVRGSVCLLIVLLSAPVWADAFVNFLAKQKVGQEITVTGGFRRFYYKRQFFRRDDRTGEVENFEYFGMVMVPTTIIGNGALSLKANALDSAVLLYPEQDLVKDLPEQGNDLWFTGILIGFQYGISGITSSPFSGGDPYILLKHISAQPPSDVVLPEKEKPAP